MLGINNGVWRPSGRGSAYDIIKDLGSDSSLVLCLDAGEQKSYPGFGQYWYDLSGNGNHYIRGATTAVSTDDYQFEGYPNTRSSHWTTNGLDTFYPTASHTFANNWHKAGAAFSIACAVYIPSSANYKGFLCTKSGSDIGIAFATWDTDSLNISIGRGGGDAFASQSKTAPGLFYTPNQWTFIGITVVDGGNAIFFIDAGTDTNACSFSSPSASAPAQTPKVMANGTGGGQMPSGGKVGVMCAWDRELSTTEMSDFRTAIMARYP